MEWNPETLEYEELDQFDAASATANLNVGGPNGIGEPKKLKKPNRKRGGTTLVPRGGQYGGDGMTPDGRTKSGVDTDARGRSPISR